MVTEKTFDQFAEFAQLSDDVMGLDRGAALIAAYGTGADVEHCLGRLDALAADARVQVERCENSRSRVRALVDFLSNDYGLRANTDDYYDPDNSFISAVLDRRIGIPISLSTIYIEVARRLDIRLRGVSFPGHFLIKHCVEPELFIDPFAPERFLHEKDCAALLHRISAGEMELRPGHLAATPTRKILLRMLANLKMAYTMRGELGKAVQACSLILILAPDNRSEYRDRGMLYGRLDTFRLARADLETYLEYRPDAPDRANVQAALELVRQRLKMLH